MVWLPPHRGSPRRCADADDTDDPHGHYHPQHSCDQSSWARGRTPSSTEIIAVVPLPQIRRRVWTERGP